jgi:hypothetical protein
MSPRTPGRVGSGPAAGPWRLCHVLHSGLPPQAGASRKPSGSILPARARAGSPTCSIQRAIPHSAGNGQGLQTAQAADEHDAVRVWAYGPARLPSTQVWLGYAGLPVPLLGIVRDCIMTECSWMTRFQPSRGPIPYRPRGLAAAVYGERLASPLSEFPETPGKRWFGLDQSENLSYRLLQPEMTTTRRSPPPGACRVSHS